MVLTMLDGCIHDGHIVKEPYDYIPIWLYRNFDDPGIRNPFMRIGNRHFASILGPPNALFNHDPARHTPGNVQMKTDGQFYSADSFHVYNVQAHAHRSASESVQGIVPLDNHIYLAVPGDNVYTAALRHHPYTEEDCRLS